jgi:hypothetical protein
MSNNQIQEIQESTLIELREDDSIKSTTELNGEYSIHLQEPITIKEGESIALKSGFVDSVAENSGQIFISEEETTVEMDFFLYQTQIDMRGKVRNGTYNANYTGVDFNDTEPYLLCNKIASGTNVTVVNSLTFKFGGRTHGFSGNERGGINFHIKYEAVDSTAAEPKFFCFSVKIPTVDSSDETYTINATTPDGDDNIHLPLNIKFGTVMFRNENQSSKTVNHAGVRSHFVQGGQNIQNQETFQPFLYNVKINLESGFYDPVQLQKVMTDKLQSITASATNPNQTFTSDNPSNNNFLKTIDQVYEDFGLSTGSADEKDNGLFLVRAKDGQVVIQIPSGATYPNSLASNVVNSAPKKYIIGCSEPAIEYDPELKRFKLLLHTPLFDSSNILVVKTVEANSIAHSHTFRYSGSAGGAIFNSVSPHSLFQKLGFLDQPDPETGAQFSDKLLCGLAQVNHDTLGQFTNITTFKIPNLEMSKNLTSAYTSVAVTYPTNGTFIPATLSDDVTSTPPGGATVVTLEPIMAQNSINNIKLQNPYFIIEVSGFDNKMKGVNNTFTNIMSVVSRYQSIDNYTSFYSEGNPSVPYIHKGLPMQINNFKVRILNPDKQVADNIGNGNSIYLEHIRIK